MSKCLAVSTFKGLGGFIDDNNAAQRDVAADIRECGDHTIYLNQLHWRKKTLLLLNKNFIC